MSSHRSCSCRNPAASPRNSHMMRSTHRRPRRSSSAMIGRPVREPRTGLPGVGIVSRTLPLGLDFCFRSCRFVTTIIVEHAYSDAGSEQEKPMTMTAARVEAVRPPYPPELPAVVDPLIATGGPPLLVG